MILEYSLAVFFSQLIFIGCRVWNIKAIAASNIPQVLISGAIIHIAWLVGIAIGVTSVHQIMSDFEWEYLPVVISSLSGGLLGSYITMKYKK